MEQKTSSDMKYYEFLYNIQIISQKSHSIQKKVITQVFENYDICHLINKLDRQIEYLDGLLSI
ncbi:MAG: hypothetical protein ACFE8B_03405 [Candidatus Hermodarchaeota archaeon]